MCTCGYTPFLDRSFTPESFNTLSRASSSRHTISSIKLLDSLRQASFNHLALCGWCSTLRVGTCSTSVSTSMGSISPHSRDTLITSPRTKRVVLDSTRRHVLNLCWHFLGSSPPSLVILCHVSGCVSPHSRLLLLRSLPCSAFLAGTAHSVSEELCSTSCRHTSLYARGLGLFSGRPSTLNPASAY